MHGKQWVMGLNSITLDFRTNELPVVDTLRYGPPTPGCVIIDGGSNICDKYGNIALVSNGYYIYDRAGYSLTGMSPINVPLGTKYFSNYGETNQISICLPQSDWDFYVICTGVSDKAYEHAEDSGFLYKEFPADVISYCVVHVDSTTGSATLVVRDSIVLQDKWLARERMTAVRHGNGRDWWLVKPHHTKQQFYTLLVTSEGITVHDSIQYSDNPVDFLGKRGQCQFSNNGAHFAMAKDYVYAGINPVYLYDFDRCTGVFSNYRKLNVPLNDTQDAVTGVCFSPDNKLLYASSYEQIYQIPANATITDTFYKVAGYDTVDYYVWYNTMATAPNGKLYIGNFHVVRKEMSYIDKPNERGAACAFTPLGFRQNITNLAIPPNMPNYALGRWLNSPCDSLYKPPPPPIPLAWQVYPNPTTDMLYINVPDSSIAQLNISIHNTAGQRVMMRDIAVSNTYKAEINIAHLAKGVYYLRVQHGIKRFTTKVVKL
jgi:hypothetical protein